MYSRILHSRPPQLITSLCILMLVLIVQACDPNPSIVCTEEAVPGLSIDVSDGLTGSFMSDSVTVKIIDGTYTENLQIQYDYYTSPFVGAYERPGAYQVITSRPGYVNDTLLVLVEKDQCHVITVQKTVKLYN